MQALHTEGFWNRYNIKKLLQPGAIQQAILQDSPRGYLYAYKAWTHYTKEALQKGMLWCSYLDKFNDPFEGSMSVSMKELLDKAGRKRYERILNALYEAIMYSFRLMWQKNIAWNPLSEDAQFLINTPIWQEFCLNKMPTLVTPDEAHISIMELLKNISSESSVQNRFNISQNDAIMLNNIIIPISDTEVQWDAIFKANGITEDADDFERAQMLMHKAHPENIAAIQAWQKARDQINAAEQYMKQQIAVSCLTTTNDDKLMWAHYSAQYTGICIEFDYNQPMNDKNLPLPVEYSTRKPPMPRHFFGEEISQEEQVESCRIVLTKPEEWKYENEWRVLRRTPGYHIMPPITCVYLGCQFPVVDENEIIAIAKTRGFSVKRMTLDIEKYTFHFREIYKHPSTDNNSR